MRGLNVICNYCNFLYARAGLHIQLYTYNYTYMYEIVLFGF